MIFQLRGRDDKEAYSWILPRGAGVEVEEGWEYNWEYTTAQRDKEKSEKNKEP